MMHKRGHEIFHYGHEDSRLDCTEYITVVTNDDFEKSYGNHNWRENFFQFNMKDHAYQTFHKNAIEAIGKITL